MKEYTQDQVAEHNSEDDCWIIIEGKVLDVTPYLPEHPGGSQYILEHAGTDCTEDFEGSDHSTAAWEMLEKFQVGVCPEAK